MTKQEDLIEAAIERNNWKWGLRLATVCITSTLTIAGFIWQATGWVYDHYYQLRAGVSAFLKAGNGS